MREILIELIEKTKIFIRILAPPCLQVDVKTRL